MIEYFIKANGLNARLVFCAKKVATAKQASEFMKVPLDSIAKTLLFILDGEKPVLAIIPGDRKASVGKLQKLFNSKVCRLASPQEVLEITGFEIGAVPPISVYGVSTILDSKLSGLKEIICGGGSDQHLLCITPKELLEFGFEIQTADISE